jgi:phospholipid-translocating ATPase
VVNAPPPQQDIHKFYGKIILNGTSRQEYGIAIDNIMWGNTVLASGPYIIGVVIYTGMETRQAQNTSKARAKFGLLEYEINNLSKVSSYKT